MHLSLHHNPIPPAYTITELDVVDSTQLYAKKEAATTPLPLHNWRIIRACKQTAGYGTHRRKWISPPGNLYLTAYTRLPGRFPICLSTTPLVAAFAVWEAITVCMPRCHFKIKWVNDILFERKKCAGILCETTPYPGYPHDTALYIGIGINRTLNPSHIATLGRPVTALSWICPHALPSVQTLFQHVVTRLLRCLPQLIKNGFLPFHPLVQSQLAFLSESVRFIPPPPHASPLTARLIGINPQGHLLLDHPTFPGPFINGQLCVD